MEWLIAIIISVIGMGLAALRSTWLVDYAIFVFVINRGIRRLVDFYFNNAFNPLSPISLTPLIISGAMGIACLSFPGRFPRWSLRIFMCLGVAVVYAFTIGFVHVQLGAVYALGEVVAPISLAAYAFIRSSDDKARDRWMRTFAWSAILASAYGWYQYLTIPPWDAFWVRAVGFEGYLGQLEPTKMSVFSTMSERGVFGTFLGFAVVPMIVSTRWRTVLSWPGVALVTSAILLTNARSALLIACVGTASFLLVNRGANLRQVITAVVILGLSVWVGFDHIPGADRIADRLATLKNIQNDGSYRGRMQTMSEGVVGFLSNPLGVGLGASGLGTRVNTGGLETTTSFGDAGYFQIALIYGLIGTVLLLRGLYLGWKHLGLTHLGHRFGGDYVMLARALIITMIPACWVGDMLTDFSIFWLVLGSALATRKEQLERYFEIVDSTLENSAGII